MASTPATRVAIVTGSAQGIGRAIALRLASDGLDIALNDIPSKLDVLIELAPDIERTGRRAIFVVGDVSVEADVQKLVNETVERLGSVDVMVANAGIAVAESLLDSNLENWQKCWSVNAKGVFLCYQLAAKQMVKQRRGGRILGASSVAGKKGYAYLGAYCGTKFAVRGLTQTAAIELAEYNIQVNAYAPGLIDTPMNGGNGGEATRRLMNIPNTIPTGYPEDVANLVSYLASVEAYFITGQTLMVDGGISPS